MGPRRLYQQHFRENPSFEDEQSLFARELRFRSRVARHPPPPWGEWSPSKARARESALWRVLESTGALEGMDAFPGTGTEGPPAEAAGEELHAVEAAESCAAAALAVPSGLPAVGQAPLPLLFSAGERPPIELADLVNAFEMAPCARHALRVLRVYGACEGEESDLLRRMWEGQAQRLQACCEDPNFPSPPWLREPPSRQLRERAEVRWQLLKTARRLPGKADIWEARVFHGCPSMEVARSILANGFRANVQNTKGWFGEGLYSTTCAPYALRYALGMRDFWDRPGGRGLVLACRVVFAHVYPVTAADNDEPLAPLQPGLKGRRIGGVAGARGCDLHYVCVRGVPPNEDHGNRTYHSLGEGLRPDADELVVNQEAQLLPEFLLEVEVASAPELMEDVRVAAEQWGRPAPVPAAPLGPPAGAAAAAQAPNAEHTSHQAVLKERLERRLRRNAVLGADIVYERVDEAEAQGFRYSVRVPELFERTFLGTEQPRRGAAKSAAAMAALQAWDEEAGL